jgi:hypothetical protein
MKLITGLHLLIFPMTEEKKKCTECGGEMQPVKVVEKLDPPAGDKLVCIECGKCLNPSM